MNESDVWRDDLITIVEDCGVYDADGKPLKLRKLITRFWGWPRKSADAAAAVIYREHGDDVPSLHIRGHRRERQQRDVIHCDPSILDALLGGLARGSSRESRSVGLPLSAVDLRFTSEIEEEGLITNIMHAVANRLGVSMPELRGRTKFASDDAVAVLVVDTEGED